MSDNNKTVIRVHPETFQKLLNMRNEINYKEKKDITYNEVIMYLLDQVTE